MDAAVFWRAPFAAMLSARSLVEYVVLDIEPLAPQHGAANMQYGQQSSSGQHGPGRWALAEAQVARKSDLGRNDTTFYARTHLGNILHPGMRCTVGCSAGLHVCVCVCVCAPCTAH